MNEVEDAILGFHIFIVGLLFLAASILTLCGIAALVRLVSLLLSAYCKKIGFKYSFRWKQNFSRLGAIFRISALNQYLMLGGKNNNLPATLTSFVSLRITDDLSHFFRISMMSHEHCSFKS